MLEFSKYEKVVNKRISLLVEKLFRYFGYEFEHERYKQIIYVKETASENIEIKIKNYYDSFVYLLKNTKTQVTSKLLKKFLYINEIDFDDDYLLSTITTNYLRLNKGNILEISRLIILIYEGFKALDNEKRYFISMFLLEFFLVRNDIPFVKLNYLSLVKLNDYLTTSNYIELSNMIISLLTKENLQPLTYYRSLRKLSSYEIINYLRKNEALFRQKFHLKSLVLYGSFVKGSYRIDSDIDMLAYIDPDINYELKKKSVDDLKKEISNTFKRYCDVFDTKEIIDEKIIDELGDYIVVF